LPGDAHHVGGEDDRSQQHLDQLDEAITERLHIGAHRGIEVPQGDAEPDADQDLDVKPAIPGLLL
jgi:hypothetical protein